MNSVSIFALLLSESTYFITNGKNNKVETRSCMLSTPFRGRAIPSSSVCDPPQRVLPGGAEGQST
jgi:hypothetical protein